MPFDEEDPAAAELTEEEGNLRTVTRAAAIKEELDHLLQTRVQQQALAKAEATQTEHLLAWRRQQKLYRYTHTHTHACMYIPMYGGIATRARASL